MQTKEKCDYLLSIIIPVYNVEEYLEKCFNSVDKNVGNRIEIILIDDGSTDTSGALCDKLKTTSINNTKVIHKKNGGLSSARNAGLDIAKGEYVFFLDSDDRVVDLFLPRVINHLLSRKYDIIEFRSCLENKYGKSKPVCNEKLEITNGTKSIERILKNQNGNEICFKIYKKKLFDDVRFPLGQNYEDISICFKLLVKAKKILKIDSEYYIYNATNQNSITSTTSEKNMIDMFNAINELCKGVLEYCENNGIDPDYVEYYKRHSYIYIYIKLKQNGLVNCRLANKISAYLDVNNKYNIMKYFRYYDIKRFLYYKIMHIIGTM